jgi:hypothetical protein
MPIVIVDGPIIPAGEALSNGVDCGAGKIVRVTCPADWSAPAVLTFQISTDGNGYNDLHDRTGTEVTLPCIPNAAILVDPDNMRAIVWLKVRSGHKDQPIPQPVQRAFAIAIETPEPVTP